jgi:hypothetical protein
VTAKPISQETGYGFSGVYWIKLFKNQQPVEIHRLGGVDKEGMLSIGCTDNIERRRKQFVNSSEGKYGHSEGMQWFLARKYSDLGSQEYSLWFDYVKAESKEASEKGEEDEIRRYFKEYGETPPLNSAIPNRKKWFDELRSK